LYEKNLTNLYDLLSEYGNVEFAIENAKKLDLGDKKTNPSTGIYKFMEYFLPYTENKNIT